MRKVNNNILYHIFLLFFTFLLLSAGINAQSPDNLPVPAPEAEVVNNFVFILSGDNKTKEPFLKAIFQGNVDRTFEKKFDISFLASPSYTREASFGIGALASGLYRVDRTDSIMPPSDVSISLNASLTGFYAIALKGNHYFKGNRARLSYVAKFTTKPLDFWGISYEACAVNPVIEYTRREMFINTNYVYRLIDALYAGGALDFAYTNVTKIDDISYLEGEKRKYAFTGMGVSLQYDTRDFIPNPTRGMHVMIREVLFPQVLGNYNKTLFRTTLLADFYFRPWKSGIIATDVYAQFNSSRSPWTLREQLGTGGSRMRGYYGGRYIDNNIVSGQIELRQRIISRLGFTTWAGGGTVFPQIKKFEWSQILPNYGIGLRIEFKRNVNARIDYGFGKQTGGFVFSVGEAF